MTHELVAWLGGVLDRIDQRAAAAAKDGPDWAYSSGGLYPGDLSRHPGPIAVGPYGDLEDEHGQHIATHSPASVLPLVAAARAIIAEHEIQWPEADFRYCRVCQDREAHDAALAPCRTLRLLAAGFSPWPGYRDEWRPQ